jgi:hypothetical protein
MLALPDVATVPKEAKPMFPVAPDNFITDPAEKLAPEVQLIIPSFVKAVVALEKLLSVNEMTVLASIFFQRTKRMTSGLSPRYPIICTSPAAKTVAAWDDCPAKMATNVKDRIIFFIFVNPRLTDDAMNLLKFLLILF